MSRTPVCCCITESGNCDCYRYENGQLLETRKASDTADPWEQNVWHLYFIDALALRYYDASTGGTQVTHYFAHDANFNHTAVFDTNKNVIERYWYYGAYGDPGVYDANFAHDGDGVSDIANTTTYTGRSLDTETGLYYYRNRYYHAQLGRFVGRDPIGYEGGDDNVYAYVKHEPSTRIDPNGTQFGSPGGEIFTDPLVECEADRRLDALRDVLLSHCHSTGAVNVAECESQVDLIISGLRDAWNEIPDMGGPRLFPVFNGAACHVCEQAVQGQMTFPQTSPHFIYDGEYFQSPIPNPLNPDGGIGDHCWGELCFDPECRPGRQDGEEVVAVIDLWWWGDGIWAPPTPPRSPGGGVRLFGEDCRR